MSYIFFDKVEQHGWNTNENADNDEEEMKDKTEEIQPEQVYQF